MKEVCHIIARWPSTLNSSLPSLIGCLSLWFSSLLQSSHKFNHCSIRRSPWKWWTDRWFLGLSFCTGIWMAQAWKVWCNYHNRIYITSNHALKLFLKQVTDELKLFKLEISPRDVLIFGKAFGWVANYRSVWFWFYFLARSFSLAFILEWLLCMH